MAGRVEIKSAQKNRFKMTAGEWIIDVRNNRSRRSGENVAGKVLARMVGKVERKPGVEDVVQKFRAAQGDHGEDAALGKTVILLAAGNDAARDRVSGDRCQPLLGQKHVRR